MKLGLEAGSETIDLAVELGIQGVPITASDLVTQGVDATLEPLTSKRLQPCQIGAFGFNPLSSDAQAVQRESEVLRQALELAPDTGCAYVVIGPGNHHPSGFSHYDPRNFEPAALEGMAESLKPFVDLAEAKGVKLAIEPYLKGVINGVESFLALKDKLPSDALRANVDPSSLYDFHQALDPASTVDAVCTGLAGAYGLVHLKEIGVEKGFHLKMGLTPIGDGHTDWAMLLGLVAAHVPGDSWVILEHCLSAEEARQNRARILDAADQAGVTLR